jgi:hypothetical protein
MPTGVRGCLAYDHASSTNGCGLCCWTWPGIWFVCRYIASEYGSLQEAKLEILCDFFKHGFDGDGDDGGSCIDGRLTSAWNWCSKIEKKKYFNLFLLTGFVGFDGKF